MDVHKKDNDGVTALMLAARLGGSEKVQLLLKEGADPTSMDRHGRSVIHWAAGNPVSQLSLHFCELEHVIKGLCVVESEECSLCC